MREIKFRGKYLYPDMYPGETWLYGGYAEIDGDGFIFPEGKFHYGNGDYWAADGFPDIPVVDKSTVGQYTGLKDKNGREIYEGDIVLAQGFHPEYDKWRKCVMAWNEIDCRWRATMPMGTHTAADWPLSTPNILEVIGNIHDNPELLKKV